MAKRKYSSATKKTSAEEQPKKPDIFSYISEQVEDAREATSVWGANQEKWHKLRMRIKKTKTFPFIGCSNIRMPTAETKIRKIKAGLAQSIFGIRPIVQVVPPPAGSMQVAQKIEKFLDHIICDVMEFESKAVIAIDQELEKGFFILKPYWRVEISARDEKLSLFDLSIEEVMWLFDENTTDDMIKEQLIQRLDIDMKPIVADDNDKALDKAIEQIRSAETEISIEVQDVIYNAPDIALCSPERIYVPSDSGYDPQTCRSITHEYFLPLDTVKKNVKYKGWEAIPTNDIDTYKKIGESNDDKLTDVDKDMREGISRMISSDMVKIWETYCWYDLNGDGKEEKCVITSAPDFKKVLRARKLPFNNGLFPFVKIFYELIDDRWFAHRGIPELIEDIIKEIDTQHMQKLDQQTIRNAPMFVYRAGQVNPASVTFMPNAGIPVNGMSPLRDNIDILNNNNPNVEFSYEREQMLLESKLEELLGQVDYSLQSMINKRQPRTLGEVQMQQQAAQSVFSLDVKLHNLCFSKLFNFVWDLWCQYGDEAYEFAYFGADGYEPIQMSKEEIQGKYKSIVRGNDLNTNPQIRLQKAQAIQMATTNPMYLQTGVITPLQMANGLKRMYQALDVDNWNELVNMQPQPPTQPQQNPIENITPQFDQLTDAEKAQVLSKIGVQPDAIGRMHEKALEVNERVNV